jgi:hypothetical protein
MTRRISYSQINEFRKCGRLFYFNRIDPDAPRFPVPYYFQFGSAYHKGLEVGLADKKDTGREPNLSMMLDAFNETLKKPDREIDWTGSDLQELETNGLELVSIYRNDIVPGIEPVSVEEPRIITFRNRDYNMLTISDLEAVQTDNVMTIDHKTAKETPTMNEAHDSEQLTAYALSYYSEFGKIPDKVRLDYAVRMKKGPGKVTKHRYISARETKHGFVGIVPVESKRTIDHIKWYLAVIEDTVKMMDIGVYLAAPAGSWYCTEYACDKWDYCHSKLTIN